MKVFRLTSVFDAVGVGFEGDTGIRLASATARFLRCTTLPLTHIEFTGRDPSGKNMATVRYVNKEFQGSPYLLVIDVMENEEGTCPVWDVRRRLTARTESVAALIHWVSPGTVGRFLGDALFNRESTAAEDTWNWGDMVPFRVPRYQDDAPSLAEALRGQENKLLALDEGRRRAASTAMRWQYHVAHFWPSVDKYVGLWIAIEAVASAISSEGRIGARVLEALQSLYGDDSRMPVHRRKALRDVLHKARCKAVHGGDRDLPSVECLVDVAQSIVDAAIRYLLEDARRQTPPAEELLKQLGV
ncbi:MAG: hypothetical protein IMZ65_03720 [Planctomycetes bacterium]|nr:hypothetical protein [Planctomycetota bacterium]